MLLSVHLIEEDPQQFAPTQEKMEMAMCRHILMTAVPSRLESPSDEYAAYRSKVEAHCGRLVPRYATRQALNLQFVRTLRKAVQAR